MWERGERREGGNGKKDRTAKDAGADDEDGGWWGVGWGLVEHYVDESVLGK